MKKKKVEKVKAEKADDSGEPSWYHYVIVLLTFAGLFALAYYSYQFFEDETTINESIKVVFYTYPYKQGETTYNIKFRTAPDELDSLNYTIEPNKMDILNTDEFTFVFLDYIGTDNGEVSKGSTMLLSTLRQIFDFNFEQDNFKMINETDCTQSTLSHKIILFNPYSNTTGVYMDENGCLEFLTDDPKIMPTLVDKFVYNLITENG